MEVGVAGWPSHSRLSRLSPQHRPCDGWVAASLLESYTWASTYSPLLDSTLPLPHSRFIDVSHVHQLFSWDCGLACVSMVLKALGVEDCDMKSLSQLCSTTSIWTIDLAHLLHKYAVDVSFLTVTIGANPSFAVESFYKENMEEDVERVNKLFEKALQVGIDIQWRSILGEELAMLILSGHYLCIALVDKQKLSHPWLEDLCLSDCCALSSEYTGHYIVICGYDVDTNEFEIHDPASSSGSLRISLDALDEARKSFGTDEDILLISLGSFNKGKALLSLDSSGKDSF